MTMIAPARAHLVDAAAVPSLSRPSTPLPTSSAPSVDTSAAPSADAYSAVVSAMTAAVDALTAVPRDLDVVRALGDTALLELTRVAAEEVRLAQLHVSVLAGEIARRSAPELGHSGLAQRGGHRTPEELVRVTTGTRVADARTAVRVGSAAGAEKATPLGDAVLSGRVSVAVADAIAVGLGKPSAAVSAEVLDDAAGRLLDRIEATGGLDADRSGREARALRDDLDLDGVADREETRRQQRSLRIGTRADGTGYLTWTLDPETLAIVRDIYDRATSPRRTPAFTSGNECADAAEGGEGGEHSGHESHGAPDRGHPRTAKAPDDDRTREQYASDVFTELLRHGVDADTSQLLGDGPVGVRIITTATTVQQRRGRGWIEGHTDPVSVATIERTACTAGTVTLTVDGHPDNAGQPLNLGREKRLFSRHQRLALTARDGGCRWPGCERPPSWCEAHHIQHWQRDNGKTDIADGILLCRHHHLLAHNNGWEIQRDGPRYLLMPPSRGGSDGEPSSPIEMPSRSPALRDALCA